MQLDWWALLERCVLDDVPEHIATKRRCSRRRRWARARPGSGLGSRGVFVRVTVHKCHRLQLLLNMEDFKFKKGNFKQKQGGHPGSLSLDYAIICWFQVT